MLKTIGIMSLLAVVPLAACVPPPSTSIKEPLTARPAPPPAMANNEGAIYIAGVNDRPMFEDLRPRHVGDVLIVNIVETTAASGQSAHDDTNTGSLAVTAPSMAGLTGGVTGSSGVKSGSASDSSGSNSFTGAITVTVIEVLPNGNLRVAGEKQVSIKYAQEYVRFSGIVNPATISGSYTVQSTQVADVHVEYKGTNSIDTSAVLSMFNRIFYSVLPF